MLGMKNVSRDAVGVHGMSLRKYELNFPSELAADIERFPCRMYHSHVRSCNLYSFMRTSEVSRICQPHHGTIGSGYFFHELIQILMYIRSMKN